MNHTSNSIKRRLSDRLVIPALVLSRGATQPPLAVTGLLMIDIGLTFGHPVGVIGQIQTLSSVIAIVFSLLMGILSVRFKHRSLLITGLTFYGVSALCCSLSPTFTAYFYRTLSQVSVERWSIQWQEHLSEKGYPMNRDRKRSGGSSQEWLYRI